MGPLATGLLKLRYQFGGIGRPGALPSARQNRPSAHRKILEAELTTVKRTASQIVYFRHSDAQNFSERASKSPKRIATRGGSEARRENRGEPELSI